MSKVTSKSYSRSGDAVVDENRSETFKVRQVTGAKQGDQRQITAPRQRVSVRPWPPIPHRQSISHIPYPISILHIISPTLIHHKQAGWHSSRTNKNSRSPADIVSSPSYSSRALSKQQEHSNKSFVCALHGSFSKPRIIRLSILHKKSR